MMSTQERESKVKVQGKNNDDTQLILEFLSRFDGRIQLNICGQRLKVFKVKTNDPH